MVAEIIFLVVASSIAFSSTLVYTFSGFGNAICFHLGWRICYLFDSHVCRDDVALVVTYISFGSILLFPMQLYLRWKYLNVPLALHLTISQQIGLYGGVYFLFAFNSVWLSRGLGVMFFLVALQNTLSESKKSAAEFSSRGEVQSPRELDANSSEDTVQSGQAASVEPISMPPLSYVPYKIDTYQRMALVWLIGLTSGVFGGLFATGGPPLMWFVSYAQLNSNETRATVCFCYIFENVGRLIFMIFFQTTYNIRTINFLEIVIALTVANVLSLLLGNYFADMISQTVFRRMVLVSLAVGSLFISTAGCDVQISIGASIAATFIYGITAFIAFRRYKAAISNSLLKNLDSNGCIEAQPRGGIKVIKRTEGDGGAGERLRHLRTKISSRFKGSSPYAEVKDSDDKYDNCDDEINILIQDAGHASNSLTYNFSMSLPTFGGSKIYSKANVQDDEDDVLF